MSTNASTSRVALAALLACLVAPGPAAAQPSPLNLGLFGFPGSVANPYSALSASVALADRWLGDDPCGNPAVAHANRVQVSPAMVRVNRQDLRADNRNYDESPAFFDGAAASVVVAVPLGLAASAFIAQPVLRLEDNAFTRGTGSIDPGIPPATIQTQTTMRELRAGFGISRAIGTVQLGAAVEWTRRDDEYEVLEESGSPESGLRHVDFSGEGVGGSFGLRWKQSERLSVAGSGRYLPALDLEGEQRLELFTGDSVAAIVADREASWEGGLSIRFVAADGFTLLGSFGGRGEQVWNGLDAVAGEGYEGALGFDYRVPESDWSLRFGLGLEQQSGVPDPRATRIGLGVGWDLEGMILDVGVLHRSMPHDDAPTSYDDRVLVTARFDF